MNTEYIHYKLMQIEKMTVMLALHYLPQYERIKTEISIKRTKYIEVVCFL